MNVLRRFVLCLMFCGLAGCASTQQYEGARRDASQVAVLTRVGGGFAGSGDGTVIIRIDGKHRGVGNLQRYEFLPGPHLIEVDYVPIPAFVTAKSTLTLSIDMKAGGRYRIFSVGHREKMVWICAIEDEATGAIVSTVVPPSGS